jgi:DNA-binding transcriptional ArsR family regulator
MNRSAKGAEPTPQQMARYADMLAALGTEVRLQILRLLLSAHPDGMVVGDIQSQLGIPASTLSHHLERLKAEGLVTVQRESTFLRYTANTAALQELLGFLFAECCSRSNAVQAEAVIAYSSRPKGRCP